MSNLFSEIFINNIRIKNRVVMAPMTCPRFSGNDGDFTLKNIEHYREKARGGVGTIIIEAASVNQTGRLSPNQLGLWSDDHIKGFSQAAAYCHDYDCKVLAQISHGGLAASSSVNGEPVAPSDFQGLTRSNQVIKARALSLDEIAALRDDFVAAAVRARKAGLDGVELHGAHGYLISQFFSPLVNKRDDAYGGSLVNRARFASEIIAGTRQAVGQDFIISCRLGCDEPDLESSIQLACEMEKAGADMLHISTGMTTLIAGEVADVTVPSYFHYNSIVYRGALIKEKVNIPVIVVNGIRTPVTADYLVKENYADFVAIGRSLLVDSEWVNKGQKYLPVLPCLRCKSCAYHSQDRTCPQIKTMQKKREHYF